MVDAVAALSAPVANATPATPGTPGDATAFGLALDAALRDEKLPVDPAAAEPAAANEADATAPQAEPPAWTDIAALLPGWPARLPERIDAAAPAADSAADTALAAAPGCRAGVKPAAFASAARDEAGPAPAATPAQPEAAPQPLATPQPKAAPLPEPEPAPATLPASVAPSVPPAAQASMTTPAAAPPNAPFHVQLAAAIDSPSFAPALGAEIALLCRDGIPQARLHLHPAELGPIAVQIAVDGAQARVEFRAEHAATCAAIEAGLPELAAALRDSGLTLSGGGVFQQAPRDPREAQRAPMPAQPSLTREPAATPAPRVVVRRGVVDVYA